jgi:hypothetical protein
MKKLLLLFAVLVPCLVRAQNVVVLASPIEIGKEHSLENAYFCMRENLTVQFANIYVNRGHAVGEKLLQEYERGDACRTTSKDQLIRPLDMVHKADGPHAVILVYRVEIKTKVVVNGTSPAWTNRTVYMPYVVVARRTASPFPGCLDEDFEKNTCT